MQKRFERLPLGPVPQIKQKTNKSSEKNNFKFYNLQIFIPS